MSHTPIAVVRNQDAVEAITVPRCRGTTMKVLLGPESGVPNFITRQFSVDPEGSMVIGLDGRETEVRLGDSIFIPAGVDHWYENRGADTVRFMCVVPRTDDYQTEWLEEAAE